MTTTIIDRSTRVQPARGVSDTDALRDGITVRTITLLVLGVTALLVLTAVLAIVRISYRPSRGC